MHSANKNGRSAHAGVQQEYPDEPRNSHLNVWDTQYFAASKSFSVFREGIGSAFMPWSPEFKSGHPFEARIESMNLPTGSVGRVRMSPLLTVRTKENIANSKVDGFYANFVMSGELNVEQSGHVSRAVPGDLVVYDTAEPVNASGHPGSIYEDLSFLISKECFSAVKGADANLRNAVLPRRSLVGPLGGCLGLLSEHLLSATADELTALFEAFVVLLPLAAGGFATNLNDSEEFKVARSQARDSVFRKPATVERRAVGGARRHPVRNLSPLRAQDFRVTGDDIQLLHHPEATRAREAGPDLAELPARVDLLRRLSLGLQEPLDIHPAVQEALWLHTERVSHRSRARRLRASPPTHSAVQTPLTHFLTQPIEP